MHKKLESELISIAHNILQMKNKNDVMALKNKAQKLYERLSVLAFVDEYIETTHDTNESLVSKIELAVKGVFADPEEKIEIIETSDAIEGEHEVLVDKIELAVQGMFAEPINTGDIEEIIQDNVEALAEKKVAELVEKAENLVAEPIETPKKQLTLEEEFKDAISVDVTQDLFHKVEEKSIPKKVSLNDTLLQKNIQVGLNDRIAFVKHLFNHSQADFNRVLSQLNSIETEKEAKNFINKMVKPDYDWSGKEEYEERLIELIERKF